MGFRRARLFFLRRRGTIAARKQGRDRPGKAAQLHTIAPVYDENSRILILGSFPSAKSREAAFFYGHPQNRFWRVLAAVLGEETPQTTGGKEVPVLRHGVALWDVIASCDIAGSSDASITNVVPNDLSRILDAAPVRRIFCNGGTAYRFLPPV